MQHALPRAIFKVTRPVMPLFRLMHLRIPLTVLLLGRARRIEQDAIENGVGLGGQPVLRQELIDQAKDLRPQVVRLQKMPTKRRIARESYRASSTAGSERLNQSCGKWFLSGPSM